MAQSQGEENVPGGIQEENGSNHKRDQGNTQEFEERVSASPAAAASGGNGLLGDKGAAQAGYATGVRNSRR